MLEVELNGATYRLTGMDAFKQFHVARRLPGLLVGHVVSRERDTTAEEIVFFYTLAFKGLSNEDAEFILHTCLGCVSRSQGSGWAPVQTATGALMFSDMTMDTLVLLTDAVIMEYLARFFPVPRPLSTETGTNPPG